MERSEPEQIGPALQDKGALIRGVAEEVLRSFELLKALSSIRAARLGLTMALRAILLDLHRNGPRTVPQIAGGRTMTRQSVQASVDQLRALGLAVALDNPAHRRSPIIALSDEGRKKLGEILQGEGDALASLSDRLDGAGLAAAKETLTAFSGLLEERLRERRHEERIVPGRRGITDK